MKVTVHIDRLVLDGVDLEAGSGPRIGAAVQHELSRLFGDAAGSFNGTALAHVTAPRIGVTPRQSPVALGGRIAGAIHAGITRNATEKRS